MVLGFGLSHFLESPGVFRGLRLLFRVWGLHLGFRV